MDKDIIQLLETEAEIILGLKSKLEGIIDDMTSICCECNGRVIVSGLGKSGIVGRKISATLASIGIPSYFVHAGEAVHGDLGIITKDDVVIALSKSGQTSELITIIPQLKRLGATIIAITADKNSTLAKLSDLVVDIGVSDDQELYGFLPTSSCIATMAVGDALALSIMKRQGIDKRKFATFHPGGNLGKMFREVSSVMHKEKEIPKVDKNDTLMQAFIQMTEKKLGVTLVVENKDKLLGIYTDGDIRRTLQNNPDSDIFNMPIIQFATLDPKTIQSNKLVESAVWMMEKAKITSLPVVDKQNKLCGLVHLHDLLSLKIV